MDYYTTAVGLSVVRGGRDQACVTLGGHSGGHDLSLVRADAADALTPGFHHMSFAVFDEADLAASTEAAKNAGLTIEREIDHTTRRGAVVADPDGFKVLFHVDRDTDTGGLVDLPPNEAIWLV